MRKLTPLHREVIRRLVTGQRPSQIANELNLSEQSILKWQKDPLFLAELHDLEDGVKSRLRERMTAMETLEEASSRAAELCVNLVDGKVGEEQVPLKMRQDAAFDLLNRIGVNRTKRAHTDTEGTMADHIIDAYEKGKAERNRNGDEYVPEKRCEEEHF